LALSSRGKGVPCLRQGVILDCGEVWTVETFVYYGVPLAFLRWVLGWKVASIGIFSIVVTVATIMLKMDQYPIAMGLLAFAGLWGAAAWIFAGIEREKVTVQLIIVAVIIVAIPWLPIRLIRQAVLDKQEDDTFKHLTGQLYLPPSGDPVDSVFTFTNGGDVRIIEHRIFCRLNFVTYRDNTIIFDKGTLRVVQDSKVPIDAGGDGESAMCLSDLTNIKLSCADITFEYHYAIETQPDNWKIKPFRFVTRKSSGQFDWHKQPIATPRSECDVPATAMPDTSKYKKITVCASGCSYKELQPAIDSASCGTVIYYEQPDIPYRGIHINQRCELQHRWLLIKRSVNALEEAKQP
jgi:hypothetical protein